MKYLKKIFENDSKFDIDFAITKIKEHFSEESVCSMFDEEILEWVDSDWADDYDSEYDWYIDHNNGEAQDVVIESICSWFKNQFSQNMTTDEKCDLVELIKDEYSCLS